MQYINWTSVVNLIFWIIFQHQFHAGLTTNTQPSQILDRYAQAKGRQYVSASERTVAREAVKLLTVIVFAGVPLSVFFIAAFSNLLREWFFTATNSEMDNLRQLIAWLNQNSRILQQLGMGCKPTWFCFYFYTCGGLAFLFDHKLAAILQKFFEREIIFQQESGSKYSC